MMKYNNSMLTVSNTHTNPFLAKQKGLVLFIALIALVVMSLAAAALIRSVDSSVLVAGNLAFKQAATMLADTGIANSYTFISGASTTTLESDTTADGYYPTLDDSMVLTSASNWDNTHSFTASNQSGYETRYILQRMCRATGPGDTTNCLAGIGNALANSKGSKGYGSYGGAAGSSNAIVYRVTVRVTGPKNTASYLQAFVY